MNKYFQSGCPEGFTLEYPLTEENFPPSEGSKLVSPRIGKRHPDIKDPLYCDDEGFIEEISDALRCQSDVRKGEWPYWFLIKHGSKNEGKPTEFLKTLVANNPMGRFDGVAAANIVKMDDPDDLGRFFFKYYRDKGDPLKFKEDHKHVPFVEGYVKFLRDLTSDCYDALEVAFENKSYFGAARPAENLDLDIDFGVYSHPRHGSYVAGHGAVAGMTFETLDRIFDLTDEQREELLETCFQFANYRTFAFVHHAQDNLAGLGLLSQTMRDEYPTIAAKFK